MAQADKQLSIKTVVTGDGAVGKTCMLISYTNNQFPREYVPTVFNNYTKNLLVDGKQVALMLWDTAGQEEYGKLRPLSYKKADMLLICFSIDNQTSFENISLKWVPEAKQYAPKTPYIIVGTKGDLRKTHNANEDYKELIPANKGQELATQVGAVSYIECSALTQDNLKQVFELAAKTVVENKPEEASCAACTLM
jgi:small GTP-binding protein